MARPPDRTGKTGSERLARVIRERREALGLSRQELADATGIPYPTIAQIETAYRGASPSRLGVIAGVLGLDPKELYEVLASDAAGKSGSPPASAGTPSARTASARTPSGPALSASPTRSRRTSAPADAMGRWHANPRFAAALAAPAAAAPPSDPQTPPRRSRSTDGTAEVVERAVDLLSELPVDVRIEALGRVQNRLLERMVEERIERGR